MKTSITPHTREDNRQHGAKIGYKALATSVARYLLTHKMAPEAATAFALAEAGQTQEARASYHLIPDTHPNHPLAKEGRAMGGRP